jgi:16S rRNA U516 pseudouridylate synthase RsuA-like enzyme
VSAITINISEERMRQLREVAARLGVSPEELARVGVEELLAKPDEKFEEAARHVLEKNAELYRRLA